MGICTANPGIQITYGGVIIRMATFRGDMFPRQVMDGSDVNFSITGSQLISGSSRPTRLIWTISAMVRRSEGFDFQDLFAAWDVDRASGQAAVLNVIDETNLRPEADPINTNAVFSTTPQFMPGVGADFTWIDFGLIEVS